MIQQLKRAAKGVRAPHRKHTAASATQSMPLPTKIILPMLQHIGAPASPIVEKGDQVYVGSIVGKAEGAISADIHSGVSGKVTGLDRVQLANGKFVTAVVIEPDGNQTVLPTLQAPVVTDAASLAKAAAACGLVGLGGAGFPTAVKLSPKDLSAIDTLIINAAECEPYITADHREILEHADSIMRGIAAVKQHLGITRVIIGIERNKPDAVDLLLSLTQGQNDYAVKVLPSIYPQGAEKVLIEKCTGREVPRGGLPSDVGCIVMNVTTVSTLGKYLTTGMPLVTKRLTVDGTAVQEPKNVEVIIGTPVSEVLAFCGGVPESTGKLISGGLMMGAAMVSADMPVMKQNNAILCMAEPDSHVPAETACIRCGRCTRACPVGLAPVEIAVALGKESMEDLAPLMVDICIQCGCCSYICPARIPLTQKMALAKLFQASHTSGGK